MTNDTRLVCSQDLMPLNEGEPVFEELLTLSVKKHSLKELLSQIENFSESWNEKNTLNQGALRDSFAVILFFAQKFTNNLPEKRLKLKKHEDKLKNQSSELQGVISELKSIEKNMWSLFESIPVPFDPIIKKLPVVKRYFHQIKGVTNPKECLEKTKQSAEIYDKTIENKGFLTGECFEPSLNISLAECEYKVKSGKLRDFFELSIKFKEKSKNLSDKIRSLELALSSSKNMEEQLRQNLRQCVHDIIIKLRTTFQEDKTVYYLGSDSVKFIKELQSK